MVRTIKQTTVREEKIRMSPKEAREWALLCNGVAEESNTSLDEEVKLPGFTRFGKDEFGIDDIQSD
ncbi:MAG: hypothetical protein IJW57_11825 [Spirochaetaceae bacterium]|nr:hypothetical protein [Spirochaetaceae bacterium]MBQ8560681.1 hypothetical protein [Spirochaetaceae bacterium]